MTPVIKMVKKEKNKKKKFIGIIITLGIIILGLFLLNGSGVLRIDINSYGHGDHYISGFSSFLSSLGLSSEYDFRMDGEEVCVSKICMIMAEIDYEDCTGGELAEFSMIPFELVALPLIDEEISECEEEYELNVRRCIVNCEETYTWDGTPINDINSFYEVNYPLFYENAWWRCSGWIADGEFIMEANEFGCKNFRARYFSDRTCEGTSIKTAGEVCTTIGKTFTCNENEVTCSN